MGIPTPEISPAPEQRFSNRVADYIRYRPSYPHQILDLLENEVGLTASSVVADVGSGTGISTAMFLEYGCRVQAVEPNKEMREGAEEWLNNHPKFRSVSGTAEATTLQDHSVDLIVAAQAFHWFHPGRTRAEFERILKPGGHIVLMWNERHLDTTPFLRGYEEILIKYATDYGTIRHELCDDEVLRGFFGSAGYTTHTFPNQQIFNFAGLKGRLLSSSYAPAKGQPGHDDMIAELRRLYDAHQQESQVFFDYDTRVHIGQ